MLQKNLKYEKDLHTQSGRKLKEISQKILKNKKTDRQTDRQKKMSQEDDTSEISIQWAGGYPHMQLQSILDSQALAFFKTTNHKAM